MVNHRETTRGPMGRRAGMGRGAMGHTTRKSGTGCRERLPLRLAVVQIVDAAAVDQRLESQFGRIAQYARDLEQVFGIDFKRQLVGQRFDPAYARREIRFDRVVESFDVG